ncbi:hypothetical protein F4824DRAFT_496393 [Ustulina deusta]|nr:hypothetical protein F4824DRAFT_496393 [Ustulina deusta]
MFAKSFAFLLVVELAAGLALDYSPQPVDLDVARLESRGHGCGLPGVVNGQCGRFYRGSGCSDQIRSIGPGRCSRECYSSNDEIASIKSSGDGTYGVNCIMYRDSNCQDQIGETGNSVTGRGKCYTPGSGARGHTAQEAGD